MSNKRAFTLIELLAVMVILGIIMTLAIPAVRNITYSSSIKEYNYHQKLVHEAAKLYVRNYKSDIDKTNSDCINIPYEELIRANLLEEEDIMCEGNIILEKRSETGYNYKYYLNCYDGETLVSDSSDLGGLPLECQGINGNFKVNYSLYKDAENTVPYIEGEWAEYVHARYNSSSPYGYPIEKYQYTTDYVNWYDTETVNGQVYTNLNTDVYVRAIDSDGNISDLVKHNIKADSMVPISNLVVKKESSGTAVSSSTWSNEKLMVTLSNVSNLSGMTSYYCVDTDNTCTPTTEYVDTFKVETEGTSYIRYYSRSGSGVSSSIKSYTAQIDTAPVPVASIVAKKITSGTAVSSGAWSNQNLTVTLTASTAISGTTIYYCKDTANTCTPTLEYTGAVGISTVGTSYIRYKTTNGAGVSSSVKSYTAKIDTVAAPVPSITAKKVSAGTTVSSGAWSNQNLTVTITASTATSGRTIYYCTDTANTCTPSTKYTAALSITTSGTSYIRYKTTNGAGVSSSVKSYTAKIDTKTPTITAKSNPISLAKEDYTFTSNVTATYGVAGGKTTCNPAATKKTGSYTVTCTATGNNGSTKSVSFTAKHSYAASSKQVDCNCTQCNCKSVSYSYCSGNPCTGSPNYELCNTNGALCWAHTDCQTCCSKCTQYYCPDGGTLSGTTCNY